MSTFAQTLDEATAVIAAFGAKTADFEGLSDDELVTLGSAISAHERAFGLVKAQHAAQVARRSRRELGHAGLAARNGFASPQKFLQEATKITAREASQLVALGTALIEAESARELLDAGETASGGAPLELPWDSPISRAVGEGLLSVDSADALRRGLGCPTEAVTRHMLSDSAARLIQERQDLAPDRLFKAARVERELMDLEGTQARQQELYDRGGVRFFPQPDGMWRLNGQLDPESAAILTSALDPFTSPRRGGPRFTSPDDIAAAQAIIDDPRSTERLALDGLLELVKAGAEVDPTAMPVRSRTLVKIVTIAEAASGSEGRSNRADSAREFGVLESNGEVVSAATVYRALCKGDSVHVTVDRQGNPLNLGRTTRLYDRRQRDALAVRDGGCLWPECDRPPAFTEAHHTKQWKRDHGETNIDDGVLLCRFHHLQLHNNGWEIGRQGDDFWLTPPCGIDPAQTPTRLRTKSTLIEHLRRKETG